MNLESEITIVGWYLIGNQIIGKSCHMPLPWTQTKQIDQWWDDRLRRLLRKLWVVILIDELKDLQSTRNGWGASTSGKIQDQKRQEGEQL